MFRGSEEKIAGFILAAGEGSRLRPLTCEKPKAMIPFCGVSMLELVTSQMVEAGITTIGVNTCHLASQVEEGVRSIQETLGVSMKVSREDFFLGTGGGIRKGAKLFPEARHFLIYNADVLLDCDLSFLIRSHLIRKAAVTTFLLYNKGPCTVLMGRDNRIKVFRTEEGKGRYTFTGVHIFRRDLLNLLPKEDPCTIIEAYERAIEKDLPVFGLSLSLKKSYWADLGRQEEYLRAHGEIADFGIRRNHCLQEAQAEQARRRAHLEQMGVRCTGGLGLGKNLTVPAGSHLHNAVVWDGVSFKKPSLYSDAVFSRKKISAPFGKVCRDSPDPRVWSFLGKKAEDVSISPLRVQGSGRKYFRIRTEEGSLIWCLYSHQKRENAAFTALSEFLRSLSIHVPEIYLHLCDVGEYLAQDLGDITLQRICNQEETERILKKTIQQIARLHLFGDTAARLREVPFQQGFTKGLYDWERDYFREHILVRLLNRQSMWIPVAREYCALRDSLLSEPLLPIHRDLQSANIMVVKGIPWFIDFQGMRLGSAAYDIGSLLFDPYRSYSRTLRISLWKIYQKTVRRFGGTPPSDYIYYSAAVQRLFQALGAYGKLWQEDGLVWYRQFILPGLALLAEAADEGGYSAIGKLAREVHIHVKEVFSSE